MQITLLHAPNSGNGQTPLEHLERAITAAGHGVKAHVLGEADLEAADLTEEADLVVAAGGDGTVGRVARCLIGGDVPMTVLPLGTANNIACTLGMNASVEALARGWAEGTVRPMDVGVVTGPWGDAYFVEACGVGLVAAGMQAARQHKEAWSFKRSEQTLAFARGALRDTLALHRVTDWSIRVDGEPMAGRYLFVEAMNLGMTGPGLVLAPEADPFDGRLDVVLLPEAAREAFQARLKAERPGEPAEEVVRRRAKVLELTCQLEDLHIDDRFWTSDVGKAAGLERTGWTGGDEPLELTMRLAEERLRVLVPALDEQVHGDPA